MPTSPNARWSARPTRSAAQIVAAYVVLQGRRAARRCDSVKRLQDHVKATIAPYKYPRAVHFVDALPKTQTGKIQRFRLRQQRPAMSEIFDILQPQGLGCRRRATPTASPPKAARFSSPARSAGPPTPNS